jgi:transcriptional regulator with XRE-family HTH domain
MIGLMKPDRTDLVVARNLRRFRALRGMSQKGLADKVGLTFQQIQKYENGTSAIGSGRIRQICAALDVTPDNLFGLDGDAAVPPLSDRAIRAAVALDRIADPRLQRAVVMLILALAGEPDEG